MYPDATNSNEYGAGVTADAQNQPAVPLDSPTGSPFSVPPLSGHNTPNGAIGAAYGSPAAMPQSAPSLQPAPHSVKPADVNATTNIKVPDESSNIEVEWVERVKKIVTSTTGNPYLKSNQLALLKTEYIKKMYGKVIDLDGKK